MLQKILLWFLRAKILNKSLGQRKILYVNCVEIKKNSNTKDLPSPKEISSKKKQFVINVVKLNDNDFYLFMTFI